MLGLPTRPATLARTYFLAVLATASAPAFATLACSRTPEEPTPVVKEMRPSSSSTPAPTTAATQPIAPYAPTTTRPSDPAATCPADPSPALNGTLYAHGVGTFLTPDGLRHEFQMEIAQADDAQERGLMFRTALADDAGMVFPCNPPHHAVFWMHNTCIALDMVFVGEDDQVIGVVTAPPLNDQPRQVNGVSKYVVELAAGVARKLGIGLGTRFVAP